GAVGKEVVKDLLTADKYSKVVTAGRRAVQLDDTIPQEKLVQETVDFENLDKSRGVFKNVDAENFKKIDQEYVVNSAKIVAEENPAEGQQGKSKAHFMYCSSMGANASSFMLYPQSKGQTEERLKEIGFDRVSIFHPGFLEVAEDRPRARFAERLAGMFMPPLSNTLKLHMSISVTSVARAMRMAATEATPSYVKPTTHASGSKVTYFTNKDMDTMNEKK
ncbi:hypothetical protein BC940DRAFT_231926, partial [Gongronella butleri]